MEIKYNTYTLKTPDVLIHGTHMNYVLEPVVGNWIEIVLGGRVALRTRGGGLGLFLVGFGGVEVEEEVEVEVPC